MVQFTNPLVPTTPFVGAHGQIDRTWLQFLLAIFNAAGAGQITLTLDELESFALAQLRTPNTSALERRAADLEVAAAGLARGEGARITVLERRVAELETLVKGALRWH